MANGLAQRQEERLWLSLEAGDFEKFLRAYKSLADKAVKKILLERRREVKQELASGFDPIPKDIEKTLTEAAFLISGGKRARGGLLTIGFYIARGDKKLTRNVINAAIGYEFLHNAFLVHDDIMDRAIQRRRKVAAWRVFKNFAVSKVRASEADHYGMSQAINLGDMIAFWGPLLISQREFSGERVKEAMIILNRAVQTTVVGQILDINPTMDLASLRRPVVMAIARNKTARYTIVTPLQIGAVLGGMKTDSQQFSAMEAFGFPAGIAFQLKDDDLGVFGSAKKIGKSPLSDLREGKKTLLFWELHRRLTGRDQAYFGRLWGKRDASIRDLAWVRRMAKQSGAKDAVEKRWVNLAKKAKGKIPLISSDPRVSKLLNAIVDFAIEREA